MRKTLKYALAGLLVASALGCSSDSTTADHSPPANAAAVVDGKPILASELQAQIERLAGDIRKLAPDKAHELQQQALDHLIDDRLCAAALARDGSPITESDVEQELARHPLDGSLPPDVIREAIRSKLCRQRLVERRGKFDATVTPRGSDEVLARQDAVQRGQRWRDEEQRIFRDLRAHARIQLVPQQLR